MEGLLTFWNSVFKRPLGESRFFRPNQYSGLTLESISGLRSVWIRSPRFRLSTEGFGDVGNPHAIPSNGLQDRRSRLRAWNRPHQS